MAVRVNVSAHVEILRTSGPVLTRQDQAMGTKSKRPRLAVKQLEFDRGLRLAAFEVPVIGCDLTSPRVGSRALRKSCQQQDAEEQASASRVPKSCGHLVVITRGGLRSSALDEKRYLRNDELWRSQFRGLTSCRSMKTTSVPSPQFT